MIAFIDMRLSAQHLQRQNGFFGRIKSSSLGRW